MDGNGTEGISENLYGIEGINQKFCGTQEIFSLGCDALMHSGPSGKGVQQEQPQVPTTKYNMSIQCSVF